MSDPISPVAVETRAVTGAGTEPSESAYRAAYTAWAEWRRRTGRPITPETRTADRRPTGTEGHAE